MNEATKRCPKCGRDVPVSGFNKRRNGACASYCRAFQSVFSRNHYVANFERYNARRRDSQRRYILRNKRHAIEYLLTHPCVDCGEADPVVLEFDHIDPVTKENNVSDLIRQAAPLKRLIGEIERCDVRCVNCHRSRTAKQFAWDVN